MPLPRGSLAAFNEERWHVECERKIEYAKYQREQSLLRQALPTLPRLGIAIALCFGASYLIKNSASAWLIAFVVICMWGSQFKRPGPAELVALRRACGRRRVCPGCGYVLEHLEPAADLLVECPECSAAWRIEQRADTPVTA